MLPEVRPGLSEPPGAHGQCQVQSSGDLHRNPQGCALKCRRQGHSAPLAGTSGLQPGNRSFGKHPGGLTCTAGVRARDPQAQASQ